MNFMEIIVKWVKKIDKLKLSYKTTIDKKHKKGLGLLEELIYEGIAIKTGNLLYYEEINKRIISPEGIWCKIGIFQNVEDYP